MCDSIALTWKNNFIIVWWTLLSDDTVKKAFRCGVYDETGSKVLPARGNVHDDTVFLPLLYCSEVELMFVWMGWGRSKTSPQWLPWCIPSFPHWTALVPFLPEPSHHWFCPIAFLTVPSCLAAGAVVSLCPAGPWVGSWCSGTSSSCPTALSHSGFWVTEPTSVLLQLKTSPAIPFVQCHPLCTHSVQKHPLKSPFPHHPHVPALSNCALCAPIPPGHNIPDPCRAILGPAAVPPEPTWLWSGHGKTLLEGGMTKTKTWA